MVRVHMVAPANADNMECLHTRVAAQFMGPLFRG